MQARDGRLERAFKAVARCRASQRQARERRDCLSTGTCEFAPARLARETQGSRTDTTFVRSPCRRKAVLVTFAATKVTRSRQRAEQEFCRGKSKWFRPAPK